MNLFLVQTCGRQWDVVYGVCTTMKRALEVYERVKESDHLLRDDEHLVISEIEADKFIEEGA